MSAPLSTTGCSVSESAPTREESAKRAGPSPVSGNPAGYRSLRRTLVREGIFPAEGGDPWRLSCRPFPLSAEDARLFQDLGRHLLSFYRALNKLYVESVKGREPGWVHEYLDVGKPQDLLDFGRMNRFKDQIPGVIRPDLILTETGIALTELDAVPGGIGLTGCLSHAYAEAGHDPWPEANGMAQGFSRMLRSALPDSGGSVAIVVSDEAEAYRTEMEWVAGQLRQEGWHILCVHPKDVRFTEEGLFVEGKEAHADSLSLIYRFYELFDLQNIPKAELIRYSAKKGKLTVTPPYKPWMEEKLALALFHHPLLEEYWERALTSEVCECLRTIIPKTWVLDPRPLPPSAVLPGLLYHNRAVSDWEWLKGATQKERRYVVKVSGFSEKAWGSRGVSIGHDMPQTQWKETLDQALGTFDRSPSILQEFHKGRIIVLEYYEAATGDIRTMEGRVRLSPYYFVSDGEARLGGVLATVCPKDKKIIHGMRDAVMVPCSVA